MDPWWALKYRSITLTEFLGHNSITVPKNVTKKPNFTCMFGLAILKSRQAMGFHRQGNVMIGLVLSCFQARLYVFYKELQKQLSNCH